MVGDDEKDIEAAIAAGCTPVYISDKDYGKGVLYFPAIVDFYNSFLRLQKEY
jgi:phosphoglycolate phosphatase-like HAD superfamily hydrolase